MSEMRIFHKGTMFVLSSLFFASSAQAVVWPQDEQAYHNTQRTPQWLKSPSVESSQPTLPKGYYQQNPVRSPYTNIPSPYATSRSRGVYPPAYGYRGGYPVYGYYGYPNGYYAPPRNRREYNRNPWDKIPFVGKNGGDWGNWDMPSFDMPEMDMPSMSFPSFGW